MRKSITANGTGILLTTGRDINNLYVFAASTFDLGGGTLSFSIKDRDSTASLVSIDASFVAAEQAQYPVGGDVELHYTLAGATSPDIDLMITQGR